VAIFAIAQLSCLVYFVVCMSVAMRSRGSEADYMQHESKPVSGGHQSAQQQCLMSSVYLPTNNYLYHHGDVVDRDQRPVRHTLTTLGPILCLMVP